MTLLDINMTGVRPHIIKPHQLNQPFENLLKPSTSLSRKQLLFIEPDDETQELLHLFLGSLFHVVVVDTLDEGLQEAALHRPDLIAIAVNRDEEVLVQDFLETIGSSYSGNEPPSLAIVDRWQWSERPSHLLGFGFNALLQRPFTMRGLFASMYRATDGNLGQLMLPSS